MNSFDFNITQGCSFSAQLIATNSDGTPLNLTGCVASGYVRYRYSDTGILLNLAPVIDTSYVSGIVNVTIPASNTANLPIVQAIYDLKVFNSTQQIQFLQGYFNIFPEATY